MKTLTTLSALFVLVTNTILFAAPPVTTFTSKGNKGAVSWAANSTWTGGTAPVTNLASGQTITVAAGDSVTLSGSLTGNSNITLNIYGKLNITGSFALNSNATINIDAATDGKLYVGGSFTTNTNTALNVGGGGLFKINGSVAFANNLDATLNGTFVVGGTLSVSKWTSLVGTGFIGIGGTNCGQLNCVTNCASKVGTGSLTCANFATALPVVWKKTSAISSSAGVEIFWGTYSEKNNAYFEIERSSNGLDWNVVGKVNGNGTLDSESDYTFNDQTAEEGLSYYRVKQVDFDGKFAYSAMVYVQVEMKEIITGLYPNPNAGKFTVKLASDDHSSIIVKSAQGKVIDFTKIETSTGVEIDLQYIASGLYTIYIYNNGKTFHKKFIVQ